MRVALIGNMNNNFFSIMRYFRDLDIDAHLFMYEGEYNHFQPEKDTYYIEKYRDYIHTLSIKPSVRGLFFLDKKRIKEELKGYDFFIGCDIAPAMFLKLGMRLDIFIPYNDKIEHTSQSIRINGAKEYLTSLAREYIIKLQIEGIKKSTSKIIADALQDVCRDTIKRLNLHEQLIQKYLLMVYPEKPKENRELNNTIELMKRQNLVLFCHTRHSWREESMFDGYPGKGIDELIIGYSHFIKNSSPKINPLLVFFEYGTDVEESKKLISKLGVEKYIEWLPIMPRKDILQLIDYADIVVDALSGGMWGGVGWEGLSQGKVLIQDIQQSDDEYFEEMGHKFPFVMRAKEAKDIERHLKNFVENREYYSTKAEENREWFERYAGLGLAKEYRDIVIELYNKKNR
jgi:hypothetical protein